MSEADDIPTEIVEMVDADLAMYRMKLQGVSIQELARKFKIPQARVKEAIERMCEPIDAFTRGRMLQIEFERCEALTLAHSEAALAGDVAASGLLIRVMEHRAALAGLFAAASVRVDPVQLTEVGRQVSTTDRIQKVLDEIALGRPRLIAGKDVDQAKSDNDAPREADGEESKDKTGSA